MLTLNVTPEGANLIIGALRQLPHAQVHDLVMDLFNQAQQQTPPPSANAELAVEEVVAEEKVGGTD